MDEPLTVMFLTRLAELKSQYVVHVANGQAPDYSEYKKICGAVEGISLCEREFKECLARLEGAESEEGGFTELPQSDQPTQ